MSEEKKIIYKREMQTGELHKFFVFRRYSFPRWYTITHGSILVILVLRHKFVAIRISCAEWVNKKEFLHKFAYVFYPFINPSKSCNFDYRKFIVWKLRSELTLINSPLRSLKE